MEKELHILTREEIAEQLYSMVLIDDIGMPFKCLSFIVPNKNYDPKSFSKEIEDTEVDTTIDDTIKILQTASIFGINSNLRKNSKEWMENHSKICQVSFIPMAVYIQAEKHENGRHDFCTEENINRIIKFAEIYGGIVSFN